MKKRFNDNCYVCLKPISPREHYVVLADYQKGHCIEESKFHFTCWVEHFNKKAKEKAQNMLDDAKTKVLAMTKMPFIANILNGVRGVSGFQDLLENPEPVRVLVKPEKKDENDRKTRSTGKSSKR